MTGRNRSCRSDDLFVLGMAAKCRPRVLPGRDWVCCSVPIGIVACQCVQSISCVNRGALARSGIHVDFEVRLVALNSNKL